MFTNLTLNNSKVKIKLPNPKEFILEKSEHFETAVGLGYDIRMDEEEILHWMKEYGELCAKHGAKSIRYQAIEMIQDKMNKAEIKLFNFIGEELIKDIQNLNP